VLTLTKVAERACHARPGTPSRGRLQAPPAPHQQRNLMLLRFPVHDHRPWLPRPRADPRIRVHDQRRGTLRQQLDVLRL